MPNPTVPLKVSLAADVKGCLTCSRFREGAPPYGPYPGYDRTTEFPPEILNNKKLSAGYKQMPRLVNKPVGLAASHIDALYFLSRYQPTKKQRRDNYESFRTR